MTMKRLRLAAVDDLTQIAAIADEALPEAWPLAALESSLLLDDHHLMVVAMESDTVAGYSLTSQVDRDIELLQLVVKPSCRRQQIGSQLLHHLITASAPYDHITLEVRASNQAAITLYQRHQFSTIATRKAYYRPAAPSTQREDAVIMQRAA